MESEYLPFFIVYEDRVYVHALCAYSCRTFHEAVAHTHLSFLVNYKPQTRRMSIPPLLFVSDPVVVDTKDVILYKENHLKKVLFQEGFEKRA